MALDATPRRGAICLLRAMGKFAVPISPSQVRPVEMHRLQAGLLSSHFTFRILEGGQSLVGIEPEEMIPTCRSYSHFLKAWWRDASLAEPTYVPCTPSCTVDMVSGARGDGGEDLPNRAESRRARSVGDRWLGERPIRSWDDISSVSVEHPSRSISWALLLLGNHNRTLMQRLILPSLQACIVYSCG